LGAHQQVQKSSFQERLKDMFARHQGHPVRVSIIIPTKDEELTIENVVQGCVKVLQGIAHEIIVVDASSDSTVERAVRTGARVVKQVGHGGLGEALVQGFNSSRGDYIVTLDGDGTYDPADLPRALELLLKDQADLVNGNRFAGMEDGAMPLTNRIGNRILTSTGNFLFGTKIMDSQSGFKGFRRGILADLALFEKGFPISSELIAEASKMNMRIKEVGISYKRRIGQTKLSPRKHGPSILWAVLKMLRDYRPLLLFGGIGVVFIAAGFLVAWPIIVTYVEEGSFDLVGRALVAIFCWLAGLISIFTGVILDTVNYTVRKIEGRMANSASRDFS